MLWTAIISAAVLTALTVTVVTLAAPGEQSAAQPNSTAKPWAELFEPATPEPITRAELMSKYAKIAPLDRSATPEGVDGLAQTTCDAIDSGISTDRVISVVTDTYHANATEVVQLLVSYKCPEFLKDFK